MEQIRKILLMLLLLTMVSVQAQGKTSIDNVNGYEKLRKELLEINNANSLTEWDMLILAICWKESTFRKTTNKNYHGYMQMSHGYVKSVNKLSKTNYTYNDARVFKHAVRMHNLMNKHLNPTKNLKKALRIHNPREAYHADALRKLEIIKRYEKERRLTGLRGMREKAHYFSGGMNSAYSLFLYKYTIFFNINYFF